MDIALFSGQLCWEPPYHMGGERNTRCFKSSRRARNLRHDRSAASSQPLRRRRPAL
jgi:hypothetical protein